MSCFESSVFDGRHFVRLYELARAASTFEDFTARARDVESNLPYVAHFQLSGLWLVFQRAQRALAEEIKARLNKRPKPEYEYLITDAASRAVIHLFSQYGFHFLPDPLADAQERDAQSFYMVGVSELTDEAEPEARIQFKVRRDGMVVSDSNYIPLDVHGRADKAMDDLTKLFHCQRREGIEIRRKPIPAKYRGKTYCSVQLA